MYILKSKNGNETVVGSLEDCYDELGSRYQLPAYVLSAPTNLQLDGSDIDERLEKLSPSSKKHKRGSELPIRIQLSTGSVLRLTMRTNDSVLVVRQHVSATADVDLQCVRLYFAGKQLTDSTRLKDTGLRKNYTVQAVLAEVGLSATSVVPSPTMCTEVCGDLPHSPATPAQDVGVSLAVVPVERPAEHTGAFTEPVSVSEVTTGASLETVRCVGSSDSPGGSALPEYVKVSSSDTLV